LADLDGIFLAKRFSNDRHFLQTIFDTVLYQIILLIYSKKFSVYIGIYIPLEKKKYIYVYIYISHKNKNILCI